MRLLILSQHFWPESFRINQVAQSLSRLGVDITVLTGQPNYPDGKLFNGYHPWRSKRENFGEVQIVRVPLVPRGGGGAVRLALNYLSFLAAASLIGPWRLKGRRFDAIFVYGTSPILQAIAALAIGRIKRAPVAIWVQDLWPESLSATGFVKQPWLLSAVAAVVRWIYRRADLLLVQSEAFVAPVAAMAGKTPVIYHPNPGDEPAAADAAEVPSLPPGFNILFAGNLGAAQSLETVVDAAERLRGREDIRFVLVGSGSRDAWLASEVERRGLSNVRMLGRFPPHAMPALFEQADALLVTLTADPIFALTVPSKVQTYLGAGKPILAALNGEGARLVKTAGAGFSAAAEDGAALAEICGKLYAASPADRARMGDAGRRFHQQHFEPVMLADRLARILEDLRES